MKIRYARQSDFDFLVFGLVDNRKIEGRPKKDIPIRPEDKKLLRKGIKEKTIRILEDKEVIGFLHFITDFKLMHVYEKFFWIDLIFLKKEYRGKDLGKLLYKDALKIAKNKGFKKVFIDIFEINKNSQKFHNRLGFKPMYAIYQRKV